MVQSEGSWDWPWWFNGSSIITEVDSFLKGREKPQVRRPSDGYARPCPREEDVMLLATKKNLSVQKNARNIKILRCVKLNHLSYIIEIRTITRALVTKEELGHLWRYRE